jgi:hypothetical protein
MKKPEENIKIATLSSLVADYEKTAEEAKSELSEIKATMFVNWGTERKPNPKLLDGSEKTATQMFLKIMEHYYQPTKPK